MYIYMIALALEWPSVQANSANHLWEFIFAVQATEHEEVFLAILYWRNCNALCPDADN